MKKSEKLPEQKENKPGQLEKYLVHMGDIIDTSDIQNWNALKEKDNDVYSIDEDNNTYSKNKRSRGIV